MTTATELLSRSRNRIVRAPQTVRLPASHFGGDYSDMEFSYDYGRAQSYEDDYPDLVAEFTAEAEELDKRSEELDKQARDLNAQLKAAMEQAVDAVKQGDEDLQRQAVERIEVLKTATDEHEVSSRECRGQAGELNKRILLRLAVYLDITVKWPYKEDPPSPLLPESYLELEDPRNLANGKMPVLQTLTNPLFVQTEVGNQPFDPFTVIASSITGSR